MYTEPRLEGKTKHEERVLKILKNEYEKLLKKEDIENKKFRKLEEKHQKILNNIYDGRETIRDKINNVLKRIKNRCKHNYPRMYWENLRDDRSFEKYCACVNCGEVMWNECK